MDGGGRLLGSVSGAGVVLLDGGFSAPRFPGLSRFGTAPRAKTARPKPRSRERAPRTGLLGRAWPGMLLSVLVVGGAWFYATCLNGQYKAFVVANGAPLDIAAKLFGFEIDAVRISGLRQLTQSEVLEAAGVSERSSLLFLDPAKVRDRLMAVPLVRDVTVRKLFPNDLTFEVTERDAAGIWQKDGKLAVIAADGVAIDDVHDQRFNGLPFVAGPGANAHLKEFAALLDAAGDMRDRIRAGIYVGERRWTLQMDTGVEVMLPESEPQTALSRLAELDRSGRITDKDIVWLDLRMPGRITARLSEDAAAARQAMLAKKPKKADKE